MTDIKKNRIHYLSIYSIPKFHKQERIYSPSGSKMEYIISALNEIGYKVNFISFANSRKKRICLPRSAKMNSMTRFFLAPFVPWKRFTERVMYAWLFAYALFHVRKGDIVLTYHTNCMRNDLISKIAKWKKAQFVYEVEEVYTLANDPIVQDLLTQEIDFLQCPQKYLFCNPTLEQAVNKRGLPFAICYGEYSILQADPPKMNDGKIHCVYAGIIDTIKAGAFRAVNAAKALDNKYVIHILGFGYEEDIQKLNQLIDEINSIGGAKVQYEGRKSGEEYLNYIASCHIGLCLQDMNGTFNDTSFPSKLFVYAKVGLHIVAPAIRCITNCPLASAITLYHEDTPENTASAIRAVDVNAPCTARSVLKTLHNNFKTDLKNLMEGTI